LFVDSSISEIAWTIDKLWMFVRVFEYEIGKFLEWF